VFKASRGLRHLRTDIHPQGREPVSSGGSVTALRDAQDVIIGYLLIGTDNTARKLLKKSKKNRISACAINSSILAR